MPEIAPETPLRDLRSQEPETTRVLKQLGVNRYHGDRAVADVLEAEDLDPETALRMIEACLEEDACPPRASDGPEWATQKIGRYLSTR